MCNAEILENLFFDFDAGGYGSGLQRRSNPIASRNQICDAEPAICN